VWYDRLLELVLVIVVKHKTGKEKILFLTTKIHIFKDSLMKIFVVVAIITKT